MTEGTPILLERDNVNDEVVTLIRWFVPHGTRVEAETLIAEVETSKANVEVHAPQTGYLYWSFEEKAYVPIAEAIGQIFPQPLSEGSQAAMPGAKSKAASASSHVSSASASGMGTVAGDSFAPQTSVATMHDTLKFSSPVRYAQRFSLRAQELLREHAIPEERFATMALVRAEDVLAVVQGRPIPNGLRHTERAQKTPKRKVDPAKSVALPRVPVTEVALSRMKRSEIQALAAGAENSLPSMVSVSCLTQGLRTGLQANPIVAGNLGAVIIFEVARLLRKYPAFNATYRADKMLAYTQVNVGYAMDDGRGLKVAVVQNCDQKSLVAITEELRELTLAYLDDKLTPSQISGGTFTISDLSGLGVSSFLPLISEDQGAILGVGGEQFLPGSRDGLYTLTLAFDHQLSEGRTAALFLNDLKDRLLHYEKALESTAADPEILCSRCGRGLADLPDANAFLVQSAVPAGHLCNLCIAGF